MKKIENLDIGHIKRGFDKKFNVKISDVFNDKSLETDFPHRHNFYMICLVINGGGTHVIDFEKIDIKPNRLFFLKPEQVHFWEVQPKSKLAVIQFSDDYLTELFNYNTIPGINSSFESFIDLYPDIASSFFDILKKIESENTKNEFNSNKIILGILLAAIWGGLAYGNRLILGHGLCFTGKQAAYWRKLHFWSHFRADSLVYHDGSIPASRWSRSFR